MKSVWKPAWFAAFAFPVFCSPSSYPQQPSAPAVPANQPSPEAKAATTPAETPVFVAPIGSEDDLRQLVGKELFIRGLWLDDELHFNMYGDLTSTSPKGSFTLCAVEIEHVRLTKRRVELEGVRYGIHFEDEGNWAEQATSFDRIRVTPKKKHMEITIDRQQVVIPKKKKGEEDKAAANTAGGKAPKAGAAAPATAAQTAGAAPANAQAASAAQASTAAASPATASPGALTGTGNKDEDEVTTQDPARAAEQLEYAINRIFAPSLDARMIAQMPEYWRYFYQAQMDHKSIEPTDPSIVRPGPGIEGPKLLKNLVAASNDYAQKSQVAGIASYKVILGTDGKPMAVAVFRPIGFGLDENAVTAIQKSTYSPAMKDGKAMMSVVDVDVTFRIYSKRTSQPAAPTTQEAADVGPNYSPVTGKASLPGLFTVEAETAKQ